MTDTGAHILVEVGERKLEDLLDLVRREGRSIRLTHHGEAVADLTPPSVVRRLMDPDPKLKVIFNVPPDELITPADWPEHLKIDPSDLI